MSLHENIVTDLHALIEAHDADIITPASLALVLKERYTEAALEPRIEYLSFEHLKSMARKVLAGRYDVEGDQNETHQGELFSGHLQTRYPVPRKAGQEPCYKRLEVLNLVELAWNEKMLRKGAEARLLHADALHAWAQSRDLAA